MSGNYNVIVNGENFNVTVSEGGVAVIPSQSAPQAVASSTPSSSTTLQAGVSGTVSKVLVKQGDRVKSGDKLIVLEAMKMEIDILADGDGVVSGIFASVGDNVKEGQDVIALGTN